MIKFAIAFYRKEGLTHDACTRHWRDIHAPLCLSIPSLTVHCRGYLQNELVHDDRDGAPTGLTTAWFDDVPSIFRHFSIPEYMAIIRPDELTFSRHDNALVQIGEQRIVVPGGAGGQTRLFRFHRANMCADRMAQFRATEYETRVAEAAQDLGIMGYSTSTRVPVELPFPEDQVFDGLDELIFETPEDIERFLVWDADLAEKLGMNAYIDQDRSETFVSSATRHVI